MTPSSHAMRACAARLTAATKGQSRARMVVSRWSSSQNQNQNMDATTTAAASSTSDPSKAKIKPVYVHHVSRIALEHMQANRHEWIMDQGLDSGLHIHPNGTFSLEFPEDDVHVNDGKPRRTIAPGRIWSSYEVSTKQHWLTVQRPKLAMRFLLKDHGKCMEGQSKVHDSEKTEERIRMAVDHMIHSINLDDKKKMESMQERQSR